MIETFGPGLQSTLADLDNLLAKTAPKPSFTVAADPAAIQSEVDRSLVADVMVSRQVELELFPPVTGPTTQLIGISFALLLTLPQFELMVLTVLVSLPVILAAESFGAFGKCATVRLLMALLMFPVSNISSLFWK